MCFCGAAAGERRKGCELLGMVNKGTCWAQTGAQQWEWSRQGQGKGRGQMQKLGVSEVMKPVHLGNPWPALRGKIYLHTKEHLLGAP